MTSETFLMIAPTVTLFLGILTGALLQRQNTIAVINQMNANKPLKDSTEEMLFNSVPVKALGFLNRGGQVLQGVGQFIEDVTDGEPNTAVMEVTFQQVPTATPEIPNANG